MTSPQTPPPTMQRQAPLVRLAIEFGPLLVFFVLNSRKDIYWATGGFMVAIVLSLIAARRTERRWPVMPLFTAGFVLVFGTLTLVLRDETFIKVKPTIVNGLFAAILGIGLLRGRALLSVVFGDALSLTAEGWKRLTARWAVFFVVLAVLNEAIWRSCNTDTWVTYKTFGIAPLTLVFMLAQAPLLQRYQLADPSKEDPRG